jgi:hypothetical protein
LRIYPPVYALTRTAAADDRVDGHQIRRGDNVVIPIHALHHMAEYWEEPAAFCPAYARLADNKLVRLIWDWDDARQRTRTKVPYADQVIYSARDVHGRLASAMAVNLNCPAAFQAGAFGFFPPNGPGSRCCEILNVMATPHHRDTARASYGSFISGFGYADLVARGFEAAYSTCTRRRLRPYQRLGAQVLAQALIAGEDRYFLLWPLRDLASLSRRLSPHTAQVAGTKPGKLSRKSCNSG